MSVKIIVDSACDLLQEEAAALGVRVLPMKTRFGAEEYLDGVTLTNRQFYEKLIETEELPATSQITPAEYAEAFCEACRESDTVLCITISQKLSGSFQSAVIAAEDFAGRVWVLDSENVSVGEQLLVRYAVQKAEEGLSAPEIAACLEKQRRRIRLIALLDTLEYLKRGGRISKTAALAGALLSIKPVIAIEDGAVTMLGKARGSKNGNNMLIEQVRLAGGIDFSMPYMLAYSGLSDQLLKKYVADSAGLYEGYAQELPVCLIGSTIGTHAGPGAIAVAFFAPEKKTDELPQTD